MSAQLPVGSTGQVISVISNKYRLTRRLGGGSFGDIYLGEYIPTQEKIAIKFEKHGARCPQLRHEYKVYRELQSCAGFGKVHYFGQVDRYNVMVMELLGQSLEDLFNKCGRRFSLKTVLQLADQVLERVDLMHNRHLIHRDIKPANFVVGCSSATLIHCIDFGLSKRYRHPRTLQHIAYRDGRSLTGTPRYASINNHLGVEQSRRDDLESIGYVLVYFLRGVLPWQGLKAKTASRKYKMIMEKKQSVPIAELCQGCPPQFTEYLSYCRNLGFDIKPDVQYLRNLFRELYTQQGYSTRVGLEWDWDRLVTSYGSLGGTGEAGGGPRPSTAATNRGVMDSRERGMDLMDTTGAGGGTGETKAGTPATHWWAGGGPPGQTASRNQLGNGEAGGELNLNNLVGSLPPRWSASSSGPPQQQQTAALVMRQQPQQQVPCTAQEAAITHAYEMDQDQGGSQSNQMKQSLRSADNHGVALKGQKRHLSISHSGESNDREVRPGANAAWDDGQREISSSRPKTAHGTRLKVTSARGSTVRATTTPVALEPRTRPSTVGVQSTYCRKCGRVSGGTLPSGPCDECGSNQLTSNHVVAGTRGMMRYRRTRTSSEEAEAAPLGIMGDSTSRSSGDLSGLVGKGRPSVSALAARPAAAYSPGSGAGGMRVPKQDTFLNGFFGKVKSFARPTSASNMSSRRPSLPINSLNPPLSQQPAFSGVRRESIRSTSASGGRPSVAKHISNSTRASHDYTGSLAVAS